jgi:RNA polymerase sigma-70 factor, ECF subfamily
VNANAEDLEKHRAALTGHCYRMLGSSMDADDAVQETLVRAWRSLERFDGRSALRTWLYRIATNVCLDALSSRTRRMRALDTRGEGTVEDALEALPRTHWLEPIADARVLPSDVDPSQLMVLRQSVRMAFVAALQHLPPRQRAALLLTEVLGWSAAEAAETLEMTVPALNSAVQRARGTLATREMEQAGAPLTAAELSLLDRYVDAFQRYDMDALTTLMREDVTMSMPPFTLWLRGHAAVRAWLLGRGNACRGSRLIPTAACGSPAFGQYKPDPETGGHTAWSLIVLEFADGQISGMTHFLDTEVFFPEFGLPLRLAPVSS